MVQAKVISWIYDSTGWLLDSPARVFFCPHVYAQDGEKWRLWHERYEAYD